MASNAKAVIDGLDWYIAQDQADGRPLRMVDAEGLAKIDGTSIAVRVDVVLDDGPELSARAVLWDAPDVSVDNAELVACAFAHGLAAAFPDHSYGTVEVWQARRQQAFEVDYATALSRDSDVSALL